MGLVVNEILNKYPFHRHKALRQIKQHLWSKHLPMRMERKPLGTIERGLHFGVAKLALRRPAVICSLLEARCGTISASGHFRTGYPSSFNTKSSALILGLAFGREI